MQLSTWNDTNQHWIPQFLLKGFGIRGNASRIYELDKLTTDVPLRKVSEVASKQGLLTDKDDRKMRDIESRAAAAVDAIRKGSLDRIKVKERQVIDDLVCTMILNDPYSGLDAAVTRKEVIGEVVAQLHQALNRFGGTIDEPLIRNHFDARLPHDWVSNFMDSPGNQVILVLHLMGLLVYKPAGGKVLS